MRPIVNLDASVQLGLLAVLVVTSWPVTIEPRQPFIQPGDTVVSSVAGGQPCRVSYDGFIWYVVGPGRFPPIAQRHVECPAGSQVRSETETIIPQWAKPRGR